MNHDLIIARYGEIGLKSPKVRSRFERKLVKNIKAAFECDVDRNQGRIYIFPKDFDEVMEKLNRVFGVVSYSPATSTHANYDDIDEDLTRYTEDLMAEGILDENTKFAIKCRRVGKHDFTSQEMAAHCGGVVNPDLTIFVEIRDDDAYIYHEKIRGPGGLPLGTQGKVVVLLSSGIDSPVAAYLMMKRGCEVVALHCNNDPFSGPKVTENFNLLVDQLNIYAKGVPIKKRVIDYGEYLTVAKENAPEKMTCVLCKSGMYRIAEKLANKIGADAIVDGSSVGQVASQTLSNILATRYGVDMPILSQVNDDLTGTLIADIVLQLLSYVAQTERDFIRQRQAEGIAAAMARGVHFGRIPKERPAIFSALREQWLAGKVSARVAARQLNVAHSTFLRWCHA